jgi:hypothetical protein
MAKYLCFKIIVTIYCVFAHEVHLSKFNIDKITIIYMNVLLYIGLYLTITKTNKTK